MSKITKRWIDSDAIGGAKILVENDTFIRGRNNADSADVNIAKINASDAIEFASLPQGPNSNAPTVDAQFANKKYIDDQIAATGTSAEWQESALDYVVNNTIAPASEVSGDRYILSHDGGVPHVDYDGASAGDIVEFNGSTWDAVTPTTGTFISADDDVTGIYYYGGSSWTFKQWENTTASTGLTKSGADIQLADASAANGIAVSSGAISAQVDDSTIEISSNALQVKDSGITDAKLAGSISDGKLAQDYIQTSEVDDSSIEFSGGSLNVKASGIGETELNNVDGGVDAESFVLATGYSAGAGTVAAADSIQDAIEKLDGNIAAISIPTHAREIITLDGTDISNGYVDLAQDAIAASLEINPDGGPMQTLTDDFSLSVPVAVTRVTFAGDLASELAIGDKLIVKYSY